MIGALVTLGPFAMHGFRVIPLIQIAWYVGVAYLLTQSKTVETWMAVRRAQPVDVATQG